MSGRYLRTVDEILIRADPDQIYRMAAEVERWPELLPHYRRVVVLGERDGRREVEMAAWRGRIPVTWRALQAFDPQRRRVYFSHVGGLTRGMEVEWLIEPQGDAVRVAIVHELRLRVPIVRTVIGRWVVARYFIEHIAGRTLRRVKELVEAGAAPLCGEPSSPG